MMPAASRWQEARKGDRYGFLLNTTLFGIGERTGNLPPEGDERLSKIKLVKLCRFVADQYDAGRTTAISDQEMLEQLRLHLPDLYETRVKPRLGLS